MKLRKYLEETGRTQAEFAHAAQTTQGRISHLLNIDSEKPSLALAHRIRIASDGKVGLDDWFEEPRRSRPKAA
jgi:transcriptional regulator with XRE-family HTH domain